LDHFFSHEKKAFVLVEITNFQVKSLRKFAN